MRIGVFALAAALLLPAPAAAQTGLEPERPQNLVPYSRFSITPFVGLRVPYGSGDFFVFTEDGGQFRINEDRGGGALVGVEAATRITGPLNAVASVAVSSADQDQIQVRIPGANQLQTFEGDGPAMWFAKAGVSYRLPDPLPDTRRFHPAAYVTVAPALVWVNPADFEGLSPEANRTSRHFALNLGLDAVARIGSRGLALSFAVEDYLTFWDRDALRPRDEEILPILVGDDIVTIDYDEMSSNLFMLRTGLSWRF